MFKLYRFRFFETVILLGALLLVFIAGCNQGKTQSTVVIYTSVDQIYSEPILKEFESETGIKVKAVYDVEATKTTGMVNRLIAEKTNPQADIFWNGEIIQTLLLKEEGVLDTFSSPSTSDIPDTFVDPAGYWAAMAGRARIIIVNTDLLAPEDYPRSIFDLVDPNWPAEKIGIAYPMFGTTATHAAALYAYLGPEQARHYYTALQESGVSVVDGNSVVRDQVADGQLLFGMTDTDDACAAVSGGKAVAIVLPDQEAGGLGALVIPNTVARIKGGPNPEEAQRLIDYLLSTEVEQHLVEIGWSHLPVRDIPVEQDCFAVEGARLMQVDFAQVYQELEQVKAELSDLFIR